MAPPYHQTCQASRGVSASYRQVTSLQSLSENMQQLGVKWAKITNAKGSKKILQENKRTGTPLEATFSFLSHVYSVVLNSTGGAQW